MLNDFGGSEFLLTELASINGWTAPLLFARGEMHRSRGNPRDLVSAVQFYREAITNGYADPIVHRNLGLALLRSGSKPDATMELREYVRLEPNADDLGVIKALISD